MATRPANGQCCPSSPVFLTHKRCCWAFEHTRREGGVLWGAMDSLLLPIYLERNLALDRADAVKTAAIMASF